MQMQSTLSYYNGNNLQKRWSLSKTKKETRKGSESSQFKSFMMKKDLFAPIQNRQKSVGLQTKTSKIDKLETLRF